MAKRLISLVLSLTLLCSLLLAAPMASAEGKEPVTLNFTFWGSAAEKNAIEALAAGFHEKYSYITVETQHIPSDYEAKMSAMVAGNEEPDLGYVRDFMALEFAQAGKLVNVLDLINADEELNLDDFAKDFFLYWDDDKAYGLYTAGEAYALFYNKAAFEKAGLDPLPTTVDEALTWDQFLEITQKLTLDRNGRNALDPDFDSSKIVQYGLRFDFNQGAYMPLVTANGGDYVTDEGKFGLAEAEAVEVLDALGRMVTEYHVAPSPAAVKSLPSTAISLTTSQAAIIMIGQWVLLDLAQSGVDFGVGVLPKIDAEAQYVTSPGWGTVGIFSSSKHPDEAYLFWKWLCDPANSLEVHKAGLWMPLMSKWYTDPEYIALWAQGNPAHPEGYTDAVMKPIYERFAKHPSAYVKNFAEIDSMVLPALEKIFMGEMSAQDAMNSIVPEVEPKIEGKFAK